MHVKHLILELHLKAKGVRRQDVSTLSNLEAGIRIVVKLRKNWKHHKIYKKDNFLIPTRIRKAKISLYFPTYSDSQPYELKKCN